MSDLYDSLEDDSDETNASTLSLDLRKTDSCQGPVKRSSESSKSTEKYSFFLNGNVNGKRLNPCPVFQSFSSKCPERKIILPEIISGSKEVVPESVSSITVDRNSLLEQGLQFNDDGSFTKSPRPEEEELPFITREYRNLQFQKKKTYTLNKNTPAKYRKKNTSDSQVTTNQVTNTKWKKGLSEGVLPGESSLPSKTNKTESKKKSCASNSKRNPNLTDSMKEKLLLTCDEDEDSTGESPRKNKSPVVSESLQPNRNLAASRRKTDGGEKLQPQELVISDKEKSRRIPQKIPKYKSDILLNGSKYKLNYWERHQLESGFNPFSLRQEGKTVPDDTNRSNFGDSVMEDLSEVSYRVLSCDNLGREEEEMFYQNLMQKDKTMKKLQRSSRSDGPLEFTQKGLNSCKVQKETSSGRTNGKSKRGCKAMFIDMPSEGDQTVNTSKKCSHFCTSTSSVTLSKVELALKARTYGYLANARNIFKMKNQSERQYGPMEKERNEQKFLNKVSEFSTDSPGAPRVMGKLFKQNSLPVSVFPNVKAEVLRKIQKPPRASASSKTLKGVQKGLILPQVSGGQLKSGQSTARLFEEIDTCLASTNI